MKSGTRLFSVFGINIYLHFSWWFVFILLAYSLATGYFPQRVEGLTSAAYWMMGLAASALLFLSVLLHELSHSFVAKARKLNVENITLFFFGGIASLPTEDVEPKTEFWMALAGPLFSFALSFLLFGMLLLSLPIIVRAIISYLAWINFVLAVFNMLPGYPLDGGRVFRALLMFYYKDLAKATRIASFGGKAVAGALVFLGFLSVFSGDFGGVWFVLIGSFIWMIAKSGYQQVLIKKILQGLLLDEAIEKKFIFVKPSDSMGKILEIYKKANQSSFVVQDKKFAGIVDINYLPNVGKKSLVALEARSVMIPASKLNVLSRKDSVYEAFRKIETHGLSLIPVIDKGKVVGIVSRSRLLHLIALGMRFGE